ncbi:MAG: TolC family protein, partial [Burkholderiaceae bacterium]
ELRHALDVAKSAAVIASLHALKDRFEAKPAARVAETIAPLADEERLMLITASWEPAQAAEVEALGEPLLEALLALERAPDEALAQLDALRSASAAPRYLWLELARAHAARKDEAAAAAALRSFLTSLASTDDAGGAAPLAAHPALARSERDIDAARAGVDVQRSATRPALGLRFEQPIAPAGDAALRSLRVSLVLQYAPDAGLSGLARTDAAGARLASLVHQADALRREVVQQIESECAEQAATIERAAGFARARTYTAEVLASSTRLFVAGRRGWVDLLNAAREDFDNQQAGLAANAALLGSRYRLALLTGQKALPLPGLADAPPSGLAASVKALLR